MKRYPFKFLDAYTRDDRDIFFGRSDEIEALYEMVFQTDLLLIYGASGTGKTSLIQCGLASKFQSHDWLALNIRRGHNLNESFEKALQDAGGDTSAADEDLGWLDEDWLADSPAPAASALSPLARRFRAIYLKHFKPLYLIFDQFEELYILGSKTEQQQFIHTVQEILRVEQPVKIILSIREEYLGHLYEFERQVPELLRKKLRVEPMNLDKVKTVIQGVGSLPQSNVRLQGGEEEDIAVGVFEKIRGEEKTLHIPLPYLQVFLDKYYLHTTGDEDHQQEAILTLDTLNAMGDIGDVLRDFLDEQVLRIAQALQQKPETIWHILSPFVTLEGTKEPLSAAALYRSLPDTDPAFADSVVQELVTRRILRFTEHDQLYEIAHDSLARQVHEKRSDEEIAILEVKRLIRSQVSLNPEARAFFTEKQLLFIEPYLTKFHPSDEEQDWIDRSWKDVKAQQEAEERRQREELERVQRQAEQERKLRERAQGRTRLAAVISLIALVLALFAGWSYLQAQKARERADLSAKEALKQKAEADAARIIADSNATVALQKTKEAEDALTLADKNLQIAKAEEARATAALEQVKKEKAATEEQRKIALSSAESARQAREQAETDRDNARKALTELEKKNTEVVRLTLSNARADVLNLCYEEALIKIKDAAALEVLGREVSQAWLEIAFWHGETGDSLRASALLDSIDTFASLRTSSAPKLRDRMKAVDTEYFDFLFNKKYYPEMVSVEGGTFEMGCDPGENCDRLHSRIVSSFQMAKHETTVWQFALYCNATGLDIKEFLTSTWSDPGDSPVVNVSWFDAVEYVNWVSKQKRLKEAITKDDSGRYSINLHSGYRLPTEAEWEYAAKGGIYRSSWLYSGDGDLDLVGWFYGNSGNRPQPVGKKKENALGLYDMSGNVWEWCWDWYDSYPKSLEKDYTGPENGSRRVVRGGSWDSKAERCRVAYRSTDFPGPRLLNSGFRLVFVP
ncbi:MAG: SUMF1/EgtB/PvdO family nonheme iron enzyme [Saprospiraceae bacterium]